MIVYCPKCGSENVEIVCLNPPKEDRISIDELPEKVHIRPLVRYIRRYKATCKDCGYTREFSESDTIVSLA